MPKGKKKDEPIIEDETIVEEGVGDAVVEETTLPADFDGPALEDLDEEDIDTDEDLLSQEQYFDDASDDSVRLYLREIGKIPLLSAEEELALAQRVARSAQAASTAATAREKTNRPQRATAWPPACSRPKLTPSFQTMVRRKGQTTGTLISRGSLGGIDGIGTIANRFL